MVGLRHERLVLLKKNIYPHQHNYGLCYIMHTLLISLPQLCTLAVSSIDQSLESRIHSKYSDDFTAYQCFWKWTFKSCSTIKSMTDLDQHISNFPFVINLFHRLFLWKYFEARALDEERDSSAELTHFTFKKIQNRIKFDLCVFPVLTDL